MRRYPLLTGAFAAGLRGRAWSLLVMLAFGVAAAACAAPPMFAEASRNAAFEARRAAVPETARQDDADVVRVTGSRSPRSADQAIALDELRSIPGLTEPRLTGGSVGAEAGGSRLWESAVSSGVRRDRARLFAVADPATAVVPVGAPGPAGGLWLPQTLAAELGLHPGDPLVLALRDATGTHRAESAVSGVYAVTADGRRPTDLPGSRAWLLRRGDLPADTVYRTLPSYLAIGDIATVERLADQVGDQILWSADATLDPGVTLAAAERTAADVDSGPRQRVAQQRFDGGDQAVQARLASGIGRLAAQAEAAAATVRQRTRPVEWAAITLALVTVLAIAVLAVRRNAIELRHAVGSGIGPATVGGLWMLTHLLPALLGAAAGSALAWLLVTRAGPPGAVTAASVRPAMVDAAIAAGIGLLLVGAVAALVAAGRVRPAPPAMPRRPVPWSVPVLLVALTAAAGLAGSGDEGARDVDLLVPLFVLAAVGVAAGLLLTALTGMRRNRPATGNTRPLRGVGWLVRRRLAAGSAERRLTLAVLTAGLGMLLFALCALQSGATSIEDRVAVQAGASGRALIEGSWVLDDNAAPQPPPPRLGDPPAAEGLVPGVRTPPLPADSTLIWRFDATASLDDGKREMLVVDPAALRRVALWGRGADLAAARQALDALAAASARTGPAGAIPAIVVADPAVPLTDPAPTPDTVSEVVPDTGSAVGPDASSAVGPDASSAVRPDASSAVDPDASSAVRPDASSNVRPDASSAGLPDSGSAVRPGADDVSVDIGAWSGTVDVVASVAAFPGLDDLPMYVVAGDVMFPRLGTNDPRLRPRSDSPPSYAFVRTWLWSSAGAAGIEAATAPQGVLPERVSTAAELHQTDTYIAADRSRGYQVAVAAYLALLAVLALCVYAQRTAAARRAGDLMLIRLGLGRARALRARVAELVLLVGTALAGAIGGVAALIPLGPRLLDDAPGTLPVFRLTLRPTDLAVTAAIAVIATVLATALTAAPARTAEEEAYRDDR